MSSRSLTTCARNTVTVSCRPEASEERKKLVSDDVVIRCACEGYGGGVTVGRRCRRANATGARSVWTTDTTAHSAHTTLVRDGNRTGASIRDD